MVRERARVINRFGIHCRPSAIIAQEVQQLPCRIRVHADGRSADGRSVIELIGLAVSCGTEVEIEADGPGEAEGARTVAGLFARNFDFER